MDNPAKIAADLMRESGMDVDEDSAEAYALFCETAVINGRPLTPEMIIIAALVNKLGGNVSIRPDELREVRGLMIDGDSDKGLTVSV